MKAFGRRVLIIVSSLSRRFLPTVLLLAFLLSMIPFRAEASQTVATEIEYLSDGGYIETVISESVSRASGTKTGTKVKRYVDSDGNEQWIIRLQGTFSYNGTSATCTNSACDVTVYADNWSVVTKSASKSGATASASATMARKVLGITVSKQSYELTLTCDKNGNLS